MIATFKPGAYAPEATQMACVTSARSELADSNLVAIAAECLKMVEQYGVRSIRCEHSEGVIVLRGRVSSYYHKQLVQEAVRGLQGVEKILNHVEVVPRVKC